MSCLTCPADPNLADVALQLQKTALEAEACIFAQEKALRAASNAPTVITATTGSFTITNGLEGPLTPDSVGYTTIFNNANTLDPSIAWQNLFLMGGIFLCGLNFNMTATTPTDNSMRRTSLGVRAPFSFGYTQSIIFTQYETTALNGIDASVVAVFATDPNTVIGDASLFHTNTASTITIASGLTYWATRLGDSSVVRTV